MLLFLKEKTCFRQYRLLTFVNIFLHNLLLFDLSMLFFSLLKELVINCLDKNVNKIENTSKETSLKENANKKTSFEIFEDASLH